VVVTDSRSARDGRYIERIGFFNPLARGKEVRLHIDGDRVDYWRSHGAQTSERVAKLIKDARKAVAA
jgi:small subunit ribosomal protein S16